LLRPKENMYNNGLPSLLLALIAATLLVLCVWQWRRLRALEQAAHKAAAEPAESAPSRSNLFAQVGDSVHEAVLLYKDVILYANPMFARLTGVDRVDLVGRQLAELVDPGQAELVAGQLARAMGAVCATRFEVDLVGQQGQHGRLELNATPVDFE